MFVGAAMDYDDAYLQLARRGARVLARGQLSHQQVVVPPLTPYTVAVKPSFQAPTVSPLREWELQAIKVCNHPHLHNSRRIGLPTWLNRGFLSRRVFSRKTQIKHI